MPPAELAPCISLDAADLETRHHVPVFASVGLKFILAEVKDLAVLARAAPRLEPLAILHETYTHEETDCAIFLYAWVGSDHVRARMFAPLDNVPEDPATGSASAALGAYLGSLDAQPRNRHLLIEQGVEMGRRSLIHVDVETKDVRFDRVRITGTCVEVMRGTITL